jgi:hypothetical protein
MKTRLKAVERKAQEQNKRNRVELPLFIRHNGETDRFIVPGVIFKAIRFSCGFRIRGVLS